MPEEHAHIASGLETLTPHDVKVPQEPRVEAAPAPSYPNNGPTPEDVRAAARTAQLQHAQAVLEEERERKKREFMEKVAEARRPVVQVNVPQPVAPQILAQTQREMAEGARQNGVHAERTRTGPIPARAVPGSTPVYRPADYVPNMNQGQNGAKTLT